MGPGPQRQPHCVPGLPAPYAALRAALFQDHTAFPPEAAGAGRGPRSPRKGPPGQDKPEISYPAFLSIDSSAQRGCIDGSEVPSTPASDQAREGRRCTALRHLGGRVCPVGTPSPLRFSVTPLQAGGRVHGVSCRPWKTLFLELQLLGQDALLGPVPPCVSLMALALVL